MQKTKCCSKCKQTKSRELFFKGKYHSDGLNSWCKECILEYKRSPRGWENDHKYRVSKKGRRYQQKWKESERGKQSIQIWKKDGRRIYQICLKYSARKKNLSLCSQQQFVDWYNKQEKKCVYCGISEKLLHKLEWGHKRFRDRLCIDRKDNDRGYTLDNICLACEVCNLMKNDVLSSDEMKEIGQKFLKPRWQKQKPVK